ncbi:MAG TPA: CoA-binding protein [Methanothrix sp.]|nr:CoA-binding protein [Methanothrix sp.]HPJ83849.1 CoA-binding protein [Methanothrix sp.]HPR65910.1 CoA-binding protein [Methanothrix sp.]
MSIIEDYEKLREILMRSRTVAVVGISPDEYRPSYFVSKTVMGYGFKMYFINPEHEGEEILGEKVLGSLKDVPEKIDILDVFRRTEAIPELAEEARKVGFGTFWLQPGTENREVIEALDREGRNVVPGLCIKTCCQLLLRS